MLWSLRHIVDKGWSESILLVAHKFFPVYGLDDIFCWLRPQKGYWWYWRDGWVYTGSVDQLPAFLKNRHAHFTFHMVEKWLSIEQLLNNMAGIGDNSGWKHLRTITVIFFSGSVAIFLWGMEIFHKSCDLSYWNEYISSEREGLCHLTLGLRQR